MIFTSKLSVQADTWKKPITYQWSKVSGPGAVSFATPTLPNCNVGFSVVGTYVIRVTATDGTFETHDDATVLVALGATPTVNAGPDLNITEPTDFVVVSGSSASDPEGAPLTYAWTKISGPSGPTFSSATVLHPTITFHGVAGTFVFRLTVSNGVHSAHDDMQVVVSAPVAGPNPGVVYVPQSGDAFSQGSPGTIRVALNSDPGAIGLCTITLTLPPSITGASGNPYTADTSNWYLAHNIPFSNVNTSGSLQIFWSVTSVGNPVPTTGSFFIFVAGGGSS